MKFDKNLLENAQKSALEPISVEKIAIGDPFLVLDGDKKLSNYIFMKVEWSKHKSKVLDADYSDEAPATYYSVLCLNTGRLHLMSTKYKCVPITGSFNTSFSIDELYSKIDSLSDKIEELQNLIHFSNDLSTYDDIIN